MNQEQLKWLQSLPETTVVNGIMLRDCNSESEIEYFLYHISEQIARNGIWENENNRE